MNFKEYEKMIRDVPYSETLEYQMAFLWLHPEIVPLCVTSIGNSGSDIIKIPEKAVNEYGRNVPVIAFSRKVFSGKSNIKDIILPQSIEQLPKGAFDGCAELKRITIPRQVKIIREGTFVGCGNLEDVYYEGTMEEWKEINIVYQKHEIEFGNLIPGTPVHEIKAERMLHIPGNEALFSANIHFGCKLTECDFKPSFGIKVGNKNVTGFFRTI